MNYFDNYGWYTSTPIEGRSTAITPANKSETTAEGELRANFTGYEWLDLPYQSPPPPTPAPVPVPQQVTMRQARLALLGAGLLSGVETAIAGAGPAAQIEWEYASEVQRSSGLVPAMASALGMTESQIDSLFITAATL